MIDSVISTVTTPAASKKVKILNAANPHLCRRLSPPSQTPSPLHREHLAPKHAFPRLRSVRCLDSMRRAIFSIRVRCFLFFFSPLSLCSQSLRLHRSRDSPFSSCHGPPRIEPMAAALSDVSSHRFPRLAEFGRRATAQLWLLTQLDPSSARTAHMGQEHLWFNQYCICLPICGVDGLFDAVCTLSTYLGRH